MNKMKAKVFVDFMEVMKEKTIKEDDSVNDIKQFIHNEVLIYLIEKYVEADS